MGLSPPARGSPYDPLDDAAAKRPIPARAGEPRSSVTSTSTSRAYPRPRGGAVISSTATTVPSGLSPPARGSLRVRGGDSYIDGPIPARAGEPRVFTAPFVYDVAYPRPRGGAYLPHAAGGPGQGLSPPARGSPDISGTSTPTRRAYPRPRGGASLLSDQPKVWF